MLSSLSGWLVQVSLAQSHSNIPRLYTCMMAVDKTPQCVYFEYLKYTW